MSVLKNNNNKFVKNHTFKLLPSPTPLPPFHLHSHLHYSYGSRGILLDVVTIRLALADSTRSPSAYDALKSFGLIQLPSQATPEAYTGAFLDKAG